MATYTSVQDGDWNDPNTWGGSGYPDSNGDNANIYHHINYNITSSPRYNYINIYNGGIIDFQTDINTQMIIRNAGRLYIRNGGELRIGSDTNPIQDSVVAELLFHNTSTGTRMYIYEGGKFTVNGSSSVYTTRYSYLSRTWASGQTLYVEDSNIASQWKVGQKIIVQMNDDYSDYQDNYAIVTINNLSTAGTETAITISEAFPGGTFNVGGVVANLARNVIIGKDGYIEDVGQYNSNRPSIQDNQTSVDDNVIIKDTKFVGMQYTISSGRNIYMENCIISNGYRGLYNGNYYTLIGNIYHTLQDRAHYSNNVESYDELLLNVRYGFMNMRGGFVKNCEINNCERAFYLIRKLDGYNIKSYGNRRNFQSDVGIEFSNVTLDYDKNGVVRNSQTIFYGEVNIKLRYVKIPSSLNISPSFFAVQYQWNGIHFEGLNGDDQRYYSPDYITRKVLAGDTNIPPQRTQGAQYLLKVSPYASFVDSRNYQRLPIGVAWNNATNQRYTFYVYACDDGDINSGWSNTFIPPDSSSNPTNIGRNGNANLWIEAEYLSDNGIPLITKKYSIQTVGTTPQWVGLPIDIQSDVESLIRFYLVIRTYEANKSIYLDPKLTQESL